MVEKKLFHVEFLAEISLWSVSSQFGRAVRTFMLHNLARIHEVRDTAEAGTPEKKRGKNK